MRTFKEHAQLGVAGSSDPSEHRLENLRLKLREKLVQIMLRRAQGSLLERCEKLFEGIALAQACGE